MSKTLTLDDIIQKDQLGCEIAAKWYDWDNRRVNKKDEWREIHGYVYATDTTKTTNASLPWNNKTHIPKLCQIRDNLFANYVATMFPKRKWLMWEGLSEADEQKEKVAAIKDYMAWCTSQKWFKDEVYKLVYDYIDYGNCFVTVEWADDRSIDPQTGEEKPAYVGPKPKRISPLDIVINPIAPSVKESPKIVRSMMTMGEAKEVIQRISATPEEREAAQAVWDYLKGVRYASSTYGGEYTEVDEYFAVAGFDNFKAYLDSNYVEILTFMGDFYDSYKDEFLKNALIVVVDRHKVIIKKQHPMPTGELPVYHAGWRVRQDNLWAMGPLDNLVGMQYRIDHVENLKADIFDLTVFPPLKIRGVVEDFEWGPFEKIYTDEDGDVELMSPKADILTANIEIQAYEQRMEEMAGAPKEAMGFRTPGEKTMYEVQRLENAASRIFTSKIAQFEEQVLEPLLNAMLALARVHLTNQTIRVIDDEFKSASFKNLTKQDLSAQGNLRPVAARHFAEKAELVQNLTNFFGSPIGMDEQVKNHFSTIKLATMFEEILGVEDWELVQENVRISELQDMQRQQMAGDEQVMMEASTPAGIAEDDF